MKGTEDREVIIYGLIILSEMHMLQAQYKFTST